jgi:hypothetical protein
MADKKKALTVFGGAAALAVGIGFGGLAFNNVANAETAIPPNTSVVAPQLPATQGTPSHGGSPVHIATLTGCISGLGC